MTLLPEPPGEGWDVFALALRWIAGSEPTIKAIKNARSHISLLLLLIRVSETCYYKLPYH